jgi:hypothetical protein
MYIAGHHPGFGLHLPIHGHGAHHRNAVFEVPDAVKYPPGTDRGLIPQRSWGQASLPFYQMAQQMQDSGRLNRGPRQQKFLSADEIARIDMSRKSYVPGLYEGEMYNIWKRRVDTPKADTPRGNAKGNRFGSEHLKSGGKTPKKSHYHSPKKGHAVKGHAKAPHHGGHHGHHGHHGSSSTTHGHHGAPKEAVERQESNRFAPRVPQGGNKASTPFQPPPRSAASEQTSKLAFPVETGTRSRAGTGQSSTSGVGILVPDQSGARRLSGYGVAQPTKRFSQTAPVHPRMSLGGNPPTMIQQMAYPGL